MFAAPRFLCLCMTLAVTTLGLYPDAHATFHTVTGGSLQNGGLGNGVAWVDYDGDGDQDIYVVKESGSNLLLRNTAGSFSAISGLIADTGFGRASAWGSVFPGTPDCYVVNNGQNVLLRNLGIFFDVTTSPLDSAANGYGVLWADLNSDGHLDLYVSNNGTNQLFRSFGIPGSFVEEGVLADTGTTFGSAAADFDGDGDQDIYVVNSGTENRLYRNDGSMSFGLVSTGLPINDDGSGRAAAWGDYDNDGDLDVFLSKDNQPNKLFRNDGGGNFADIKSAALAGGAQDTRGAAWADYDNDGDLDIFITNDGQDNVLARNDGDFFTDVSTADVTGNGPSRGVAWADYDGDGDLDLYVAHANAADELLRNDQPPRGANWLHLDLTGDILAGSNESAIGARVRAFTGGVGQTREVTAGSGWASQQSLEVEFGLGNHAIVDSVLIRWPSGTREKFVGVAVNQRIEIQEGATWIDASTAPVNDPTAAFTSAWGDYDGDGDPDLYLGNLQGTNRLFRNDDAAFVDITPVVLADPFLTAGTTWADYDNDGDLDLTITTADATPRNKIFRNDGDDDFVEFLPSGLASIGSVLAHGWGDYDLDGDLDLFLGRFLSQDDVLLRNDGSDLVEVTPAVLQSLNHSLGISWIDYDTDGDVDLFVASAGASGGAANGLYRNDSGLGFVSILDAVLTASGDATLAAAWGDFDNDGDLDAYLSNDDQANVLARNDGTAFADVTTALLADAAEPASATPAWGDIDLDGDLDLLLTCGDCNDKIFRNDGGVFTEASGSVFQDSGPARGLGLADYDDDGDLDAYVVRSSATNRLLENVLPTQGVALKVRLTGVQSNRSGIGTRVEVWDDGVVRVRQLESSNGYTAGNDLTLHFGLGATSQVDSVIVRWPSGTNQTLTDVAVPATIHVLEQLPYEGFLNAYAFAEGSDLLYEARPDLPASNVIAGLFIDGSAQLAMGPDERTLYVRAGFGLKILDPTTPGVPTDVPFISPASPTITTTTGLAHCPITGRLYVWGSDNGTSEFILTVDPATGQMTILGEVDYQVAAGFFDPKALAVAPDGTLYLGGTTDGSGVRFWVIDPNTMNAELGGTVSIPNEGIQDMAFLGDELWYVRRVDSTFFRVSTGIGSTDTILESTSISADLVGGLTHRSCVDADAVLMAADKPGDSGGAILLDWSTYSPAPGVTKYEVVRSLESCGVHDPTLAALGMVELGTTSFTDAALDQTAYYYGVRALSSGKVSSIVETLTGPPAIAFANVVINEFAPSGGVPKRGKRVGEFVEIRNLSAAPVDLTGFRLGNGPDAPTPDEEPLPGVVVPGDGLFVHTLATIDLPDDGGTLQLLPPTGIGYSFDVVGYGTAGGAPTVPAGFTVSRADGTDANDPDAESFEATDPTTGQLNNIPPPDLGGSLVFNEILYTEGVLPFSPDYIELFNRQGTSAVLDKLVLSDGISFFDTLSVGVSLGPGGIAALYQGDPGSFTNDIQSNLLYLYKVRSNGTLQRIDQLGWGGGPFPGEPPTDALVRIPDGAAVYLGNQGANWLDCGGGSVLEYGPRTPGQINSDPSALQFFIDPAGQGHYLSINAALADVSTVVPGSRLLVAAGTYFESIALRDGIEVIGLGGNPAEVVLRGDGVSPSVSVIDATGVRLVGLTLEGADGAEGSALTVQNSDLDLMQLRFLDNRASGPFGVGGPILIQSGTALFEGCQFVGNSTSGDGGALTIRGGQTTLRDCLLVLNEADGNGGAVYVQGGSALIEHSILDRNATYALNGAALQADGAGIIDATYSIVTFDLAGAALGSSPSSLVNFGCGVLFGQGEALNMTGIQLGDILAQDPLFCQPLALNYAYDESSPLVNGLPTCSDVIGMTGPPCGILPTDVSTSETPARSALLTPSPNPFNPATLLRFELHQAGRASIRLFDARGRWIGDVLAEEHLPAGRHERTWAGRDHRGKSVASGVYFARLELEGKAVGIPQRLVLLK